MIATPTAPSSEGRTGNRRAAAVIRSWFGGHPVLTVAVQRLLTAVPLLLAVSLLSFVLVWLAPGDPARNILGANAAPEAYETLREQLGLNLPLYAQYWDWLSNALSGNLGSSLFSGVPVAAAIGQRLPITVSLIFGSLIVSIVIGAGLGIVSALRGGVMGKVIDALALIGFALPAFWLAAQLISVFAVQLRWFPSTGYIPLEESPLGWIRSITLPVAALALYGVAAIAKQTREAMLEALASEHIRAARANGIPTASLVLRHALRNASITVVTVIGILFATMLGGTIFVENVFALPGLGSLIVGSAIQKDLPMVQGVALFFTIVIIAINLIVDLLYTWLDPKLRIG